jgi:hypothetical protein
VKRALVLFAASSCVGYIGDVSPPDPDGPRNLCEAGGSDIAGPRLLRRLTRGELEATIRAGFGLSPNEWAGPAVPADPAGRNGFTNNVDRLIVDDAYARGLRATALAVGDAVVAAIDRILPCANLGGESCAQTFLDTVGRRLYRRPLTAEEEGRYLDLLDQVSQADDFATWVRWATVAMVQSPHVVYRSELGEPDGDGYRLTGYEVAASLAFSLTGGPPDDALLDRAAAGELDDPAGIAAVAGELAAGPSTRAMLLRFFDQWLGLSPLGNVVKDPAVFPGFTPEVRSAMRAETDAFLAHVLDSGGGVEELLTSTETFVDATLAGFYGWGTPGAASTRPEGWGVGLLAQGSLLTIGAGNLYTSPTQRGLLVRERLLCTDMPPPPPVVGDIPAPTGNETTRDRYEQHAADEACYGCHKMMDPIGFTFEHLDATGRFRATEGAFPIDDTGAVDDTPVTGPVELAALLADTPAVGTCVAAFMASHAYGLDHHDTSCLVTTPAARLAAGEIGLLDFYRSLASAPHFTRRTD